MSEYERGKMEITSHEKTFAGFLKAIVWVAVVTIAVLIFLALFNS